jgi:hypothetical protein
MDKCFTSMFEFKSGPNLMLHILFFVDFCSPGFMVFTWHVRIQVVSRTGCANIYSFFIDFARLDFGFLIACFEFKSYPGPDAP